MGYVMMYFIRIDKRDISGVFLQLTLSGSKCGEFCKGMGNITPTISWGL